VRTHPYRSLEQQCWFKLILGASFQNLPAVESLSLIWSLAGVDCIDVCADPAVLKTVEAGFNRAQALDPHWQRPWVMVSLNDGADPHFRKAYFPPDLCPEDCPRPCIKICPVQAIDLTGVDRATCYGCGRCQPVCPLGLIAFEAIEPDPEALGRMLQGCAVDALEIHTHVGNLPGFYRLWAGLGDWTAGLKLVSISFPDAPGLREHLEAIGDHLAKSNLCPAAKSHLIWQTDGLPMSGDQGASRAKAAIQLAQKVLSWQLPGYVQLAGGTNQHSVALAQGLGIAGIAYGSYARQRVQAFLDVGERPLSAVLTDAVPAARALVAHTATIGKTNASNRHHADR